MPMETSLELSVTLLLTLSQSIAAIPSRRSTESQQHIRTSCSPISATPPNRHRKVAPDSIPQLLDIHPMPSIPSHEY